MPEPFKTCLKRLVAIWIVGQIAGTSYHRKPMLRLAVARPRGILQPLKIAFVLCYIHFSAIPFPVFVVKMAAPTGAASVVVKWTPHSGRLALTSSSRFFIHSSQRLYKSSRSDFAAPKLLTAHASIFPLDISEEVDEGHAPSVTWMSLFSICRRLLLKEAFPRSRGHPVRQATRRSTW